MAPPTIKSLATALTAAMRAGRACVGGRRRAALPVVAPAERGAVRHEYGAHLWQQIVVAVRRAVSLSLQSRRLRSATQENESNVH